MQGTAVIHFIRNRHPMALQFTDQCPVLLTIFLKRNHLPFCIFLAASHQFVQTQQIFIGPVNMLQHFRIKHRTQIIFIRQPPHKLHRKMITYIVISCWHLSTSIKQPLHGQYSGCLQSLNHATINEQRAPFVCRRCACCSYP